jgi:hypothetical protein
MWGLCLDLVGRLIKIGSCEDIRLDAQVNGFFEESSLGIRVVVGHGLGKAHAQRLLLA